MKKTLLLVVLVLLIGLILIPLSIQADTGNIEGYAWSDNTGWISFTCLNTTTCASSGGVDYGVTENGDGTLTGYAWSEHIGWIKFGGLSNFPSGTGTYSQNAQLVSGQLRGWARACAGTLNGDCSSMTDRGDGWDGWISLYGTGYGVTKSGEEYRDYAWGSEVMGWILFDIQNKFPAVCVSCGPTTPNVGTADLDVRSGGAGGTSLSGNGAVPYGTVPTFVWTITGPTMSCDITKTAGGTAFTSILGQTASGSQAGNPLTSAGLHTYHLACTNPTVTEDVSFTVEAQPAGLSLGPTETIDIQFIGGSSADSEIQNIFVTPSGGLSNPVTISITGYPTPPMGTTFTYSLGGGAFVANPPGVVINSPYNVGTTLQVRVSQKITDPYTITLTGTASGAPSATKDIIIEPRGFEPTFIEN